ncbi:hypothetical protein ABIE65_003651 [Constrictibacter sp. MBR-5]|jgi:hypothetical protein|uniref:phage holin family protein n=1 Tax=Constrictibacter sp. MBR-5 TaxID=3156467 RepID=UPI0033987286
MTSPERGAASDTIEASFSRLGQLAASLVRDEMALAKAEAGEKARQLALGAGAVVVGAMISLAGVIVLYEGFVAAMRDFAGVHPVFSALGASILIAVIAGWLVYSAVVRLKPSGLVPRHTIDSLRRDREMLETLGR